MNARKYQVMLAATAEGKETPESAGGTGGLKKHRTYLMLQSRLMPKPMKQAAKRRWNGHKSVTVRS